MAPCLACILYQPRGLTPVYNKTYTCTSREWTFTGESVCVYNRVGQVVSVYDLNNVAGLSSSSTVTTGKLAAQAFDETKLWYLDRTHNSVSNTNPAVAFSMHGYYGSSTFNTSIAYYLNFGSGYCNMNYNYRGRLIIYLIQYSVYISYCHAIVRHRYSGGFALRYAGEHVLAVEHTGATVNYQVVTAWV